MHVGRVGGWVCCLLVLISLSPGLLGVEPVKPKPKVTKWISFYDNALLQARKEKKLILAYFSGSDWEPYTQKLEHDVLNTDLFRDWATEHVILFQADYPRDKPISGNTKAQNERLRQKYSIIKVPTFILMDSSGLPFARAGYDEAKLRDEEGKGQPQAWIKYLEETIKNRPPDEALIKQKNIADCIAYGKKHFISSVFLIKKGVLEHTNQMKEQLVSNQTFVRFINRNVAYCEIDWPFDGDVSPDAAAFRNFVTANDIGDSPLQLVIWDMQTHKVKRKIATIDPSRVDTIISVIESSLPRLDYNSGWIDDYRLAQAIAHQQKRYIFLAFTSMDSSDYSKKIDEEIFQTPEFKDYARKHLVTVRIDFPQATTQPASTSAQNKILAEMFAIRGFPQVILLNPLGQKIGDSKYMKGGPDPFLKELSQAVKIDEDKRALLDGDR